MQKAFTCAVMIGAAVLTVAAQSCDAQKQALRVFTDQKLNLLRPARDYVQPGGLVFLAPGGTPEYDDPVEPVHPERGNLTDFRAVILEEARKSSTGFAAALGLANGILPVPIGLKMAGSSEVTLGGIETTGVRLQTTAIDSLLKRPAMIAAIVPDLKKRIRVFVVQEIYRATSLDLKATKNQKMEVSFNDDTPVASCSAGDGTKDTGKPTTKPEESKLGGAKPETKPAESKAAESRPAESKPADTKTADTNPAGSKSAGDSQTDANTLPKIGGSVCITREFSLKFTTKTPIPFAVRLAELEILDGQLRRKRGADVMKTTLGSGGEISASLIDRDEPAVKELQHRNKNRK